MDVSCAADVMARESRRELGCAVGVGRLDAAVEGGVYVSGVRIAGAIEDGNDPRVDSG